MWLTIGQTKTNSRPTTYLMLPGDCATSFAMLHRYGNTCERSVYNKSAYENAHMQRQRQRPAKHLNPCPESHRRDSLTSTRDGGLVLHPAPQSTKHNVAVAGDDATAPIALEARIADPLATTDSCVPRRGGMPGRRSFSGKTRHEHTWQKTANDLHRAEY